jgi:mannosyltransferase OCH1-like enzyme
MRIPKKLGQIWIGPKKAPLEWMRTWPEKHPDWSYTLYDNEWLAKATLRLRPQIDEYMKRGWYAGAADLMRYEILYSEGGYMAGADSLCLHAVDELFEDGGELYTVYENEFMRGQLVAPLVASVPGHPFVAQVIDLLAAVEPRDLDHPWRQTGNLFIAELIEKERPEIVIWPSHTLIPEHFTGRKYMGSEKVYAKQFFGETTGAYQFASLGDRIRNLRSKLYASAARKHLRKVARLR